MNLDDARLPTKHMIGGPSPSIAAFIHLDAGRVEPPGKVVADRVQRPGAVDMSLRNMAGELMACP